MVKVTIEHNGKTTVQEFKQLLIMGDNGKEARIQCYGNLAFVSIAYGRLTAWLADHYSKLKNVESQEPWL